jgi:hypothetical protein
MSDLAGLVSIPESRLIELNRLLTAVDGPVLAPLLEVVDEYGGVERINAMARRAREMPRLLSRLEAMGSPYLDDLGWLRQRRDAGDFVSLPEYRRAVIGADTPELSYDPEYAVTLEISACQFFPWIIAEAKQAMERRELMPGRYVRVRSMREQVADQGDTIAFAAAMRIVGASYVETLDTKGTDGSNVHLGGPDTFIGYLGGVGQPNDHAVEWADEYLHYYTEYGIDQVLNVNPGTILVGYLLYKMGIDISFKVSVFVGNDNPYSVLWTLMTAWLLARPDGSTPLVGLNLANSVDNETILKAAEIRRQLGFERVVRIEHHITETYRHIVRQPYNRRDDFLQIAGTVANVSAKHEGGDPDVEAARARPSDILDYFVPQTEHEAAGQMPALLRNYMDKHDALNATARALTIKGVAVIPAAKLHGGS